MYDFNSIANRLMKAEFEDYKDALKKFLAMVDACPVIKAYLDDCDSPTIPDIADEVKQVTGSYGDSIFSTGDTATEETANILAILRYLADSNIEIHYAVQGYSSSNKFRDIIQGFNERFVLILIRNIEGYLTKMGIDMGLDETVQYNITVNNGQVNLASDNAVINATVNNGINQAELQALLDKVLSESKTKLTAEEAEMVNESVEVIKQELKQDKPKRSVLRGILTTLQAIKGTAEFGAAVVALYQFIQPLL